MLDVRCKSPLNPPPHIYPLIINSRKSKSLGQESERSREGLSPSRKPDGDRIMNLQKLSELQNGKILWQVKCYSILIFKNLEKSS